MEALLSAMNVTSGFVMNVLGIFAIIIHVGTVRTNLIGGKLRIVRCVITTVAMM